MKTALILASLMVLSSAQYYDQIAMESGVENSPQYVTYSVAPPPQQQQQILIPQQSYQQVYTNDVQAQNYEVPANELFAQPQQTYIADQGAQTIVHAPVQPQQQVQYIEQYETPGVTVATQPQLQYTPVYNQAVETYSSPVAVQENYVAPETQYVQVDAAPQTFVSTAPVVEAVSTPVVKVSESINDSPPPVVRLRENYQDSYQNSVSVSNTKSQAYSPPVQESYAPPPPANLKAAASYVSPGFSASSIVKTGTSVSSYGPPGYIPPAVVETFIPTAKMTDVDYGGPVPVENDIVKISQSLIAEGPPPQNYGPPQEIRQFYGTPGPLKEHKHIYVHTAPQTPIYPQKRILQPINKQPEKHYQIIFVKAPNPTLPQRTEIELPPPPVQKTLVYVLTRTPESNHDVKILAPLPTKQSAPEVYFIRYAANAPDLSKEYGTPIGQPVAESYGPPVEGSYSSASSLLGVYAPRMKHSSYNANTSGYHKRETPVAKKEAEDKKIADESKSETMQTSEI